MPLRFWLFPCRSQQLLICTRACTHERKAKFGKDLAILTSASLGKDESVIEDGGEPLSLHLEKKGENIIKSFNYLKGFLVSTRIRESIEFNLMPEWVAFIDP